jgi:TonB family protein
VIWLLLALLCLASPASAQRPADAIVPPVVIESSQVNAVYPDSARRVGAFGTTTLLLHVLANGEVGEVRLEKSAGHADLDLAAIAAARRWRFQPARRGETPVPVWVRLAMTVKRPQDSTPDAPTAGKVGKIAAVDGSATVQRVGRAGAVPLKPGDEVVLQDTITTAAGARVDMQIGGAMEVALRERSTMTISEVSGRPSVDLEVGQLTLVVHGERLRPAETIDVRTPNAVATLRSGSRLHVEAVPATQGYASAITHTEVVEGTASVTASVDFKNPLLYRGLPPDTIDLRAGQGITITGEVPGAIRAARP